MSEPWLQSDTWSVDRAKSFLYLGSSSSSSSTSAMKRSGREGNIEFSASSVRYNHLRSGTMSSTDLLHQYSDIYNKFGRVGIYTKDVSICTVLVQQQQQSSFFLYYTAAVCYTLFTAYITYCDDSCLPHVLLIPQKFIIAINPIIHPLHIILHPKS